MALLFEEHTALGADPDTEFVTLSPRQLVPPENVTVSATIIVVLVDEPPVSLNGQQLSKYC
jgi:hypothetical protein